MNRFSLQLDEIKAAFAAEPNPSLDIRLERIARIEKMIQANEDKICRVVSADFGVRHPIETRLAEFQMIYQACQFTRQHLKEWMRPEQVDTPITLGSSEAWIQTKHLA